MTTAITSHQTVRSAPTILQFRVLDGATVVSSTPTRSAQYYAICAICTCAHYADLEAAVDDSATILSFDRDGNQIVENDPSIRAHLVSHLKEWLKQHNEPRWIRGLSPTEPSSPRSKRNIFQRLHTLCATILELQGLERQMQADLGGDAHVDENTDHYHPELQGDVSTNVFRLTKEAGQ